MIKGIASVWFPVADWDRAKRFYGEVLGFRLLMCDDTAGWAAYSVENTSVPVFLCLKPEAAGHRRGSVVGFHVVDASSFLAKLKQHGATVSEHVQEGPDTRVYTVADPDGNVFELAEQVKP